MKYEITDFAHPKYPWLHRIRALIDVNEKVPKGSLGGYVQSENNLSQEGECWIYDQAICCEEATVEEEAGLLSLQNSPIISIIIFSSFNLLIGICHD